MIQLAQIAIPSVTLPLNASFETSSLLLVAGLLLITLYLLMSIRKRYKQRSRQTGPHEQIEKVRQMRGMHGDLEDLMVEIEQLAKRIGAQLDAKAIQLERLLDEAQQMVKDLQAAKQEGSAHQPTENLLDTATPQGNQEKSEQPGESYPDDPLARSVYALADEGFDSSDIALKLDEHVGKVELILALRSA